MESSLLILHDALELNFWKRVNTVDSTVLEKRNLMLTRQYSFLANLKFRLQRKLKKIFKE